jgi:23S rRNA (cytidine1920-2'-O)/16S rRNA (cytidine1409-2'-O)-methyltransferase
MKKYPCPMERERLDKALIRRGLVLSRERARALIMEGKVLVDGIPITKAGSLVREDSIITLKEPDIPYVSRGGLKLEAISERFGIVFEGKVAMDVGVSTGGLTDYMLRHGAKRVYAVDVGYGQIDWTLRNNPRVVLLERTNIRYLEALPEAIDIATIDVSFISLRLVLPKVLEFLKPDGEIIALFKPQFEVGRENVSKGGIVKDVEARKRALESMRGFIEKLGLEELGTIESPIKGRKGNIEYLIYMRKRQ